MGLVSQLEPLTFAGEYHLVFTDDIASAQGMHADLVFRTFPDKALAPMDRVVIFVYRSNILGQLRGSTARRVLLPVVMDLHDLGVKIWKSSGYFLDDLEKKVRAGRHVGADHHRDLRRKNPGFFGLFASQAGRA